MSTSLTQTGPYCKGCNYKILNKFVTKKGRILRNFFGTVLSKKSSSIEIEKLFRKNRPRRYSGESDYLILQIHPSGASSRPIWMPVSVS